MRLEAGENLPKLVNGIIEIPNDSRAKYELVKDSELLRLDIVLFSTLCDTPNYGLIPQTYCDDGDLLDMMILSQKCSVPLCIVSAKSADELVACDSRHSLHPAR